LNKRRGRLAPAITKVPRQTFDVAPSLENGAGASTAPRISLDLPGTSNLMPPEQDLTEMNPEQDVTAAMTAAELSAYASAYALELERRAMAAMREATNLISDKIRIQQADETPVANGKASDSEADTTAGSNGPIVSHMRDTTIQLAEQRETAQVAAAVLQRANEDMEVAVDSMSCEFATGAALANFYR
jgi:hypothetical protein